MSANTTRCGVFILLLTVIVIVSFWPLVFTKQFTTLAQWEIVNQAYAWDTYAAKSIQSGSIPLWDPYRFAGNTFVGEMQTGLFYPFKLALYLLPLDSNALLSERAFNEFFVFSHWLAAIWMFALARYLKLGRLSSTVAATCFALGGFMRVAPWPNIIDAMVWLPLIVLFSLRAFDSDRASDRLFNAARAGASLGMTLLAGSIHVTIMDGLVVATLAVHVGLSRSEKKSARALPAVVIVVVAVSALVGAVQLLPSLEYAPLAYRWFGGSAPVVASERIPYASLAHGTNFSPKAIFALLLGQADAGDSDFSPYLGVLPLILVVIGAWKCWNRRLIRYLVGLAALSFLYTWGGFSFIHGALYLLPILEKAREPDRFIYLTQFAMAILAGFGIHILFEDREPGGRLSLSPLLSILKWVVIVFAIMLAAASLGLKIPVNDFTYLTFFFVAASYVLLLIAQRDNAAAALPYFFLCLIVWDLYAFAPLDSKAAMHDGNRDYLAQLVHDRELADFFKAKPHPARVHFDAMEPPNLGHAYGVPVTWAMSATMLVDYTNYLGHPRRNQLFNVRYTIQRKDKTSTATPVYTDDVWNVYENPDALPRGWIVHRVELDTLNRHPLKRLDDPTFDLKQTALVEELPNPPIARTPAIETDRVEWISYAPNSMAVETTTDSPGLLILSEVFYPGWACEVDGTPAKIYRANGILRAVRVESGTHRVSMRYRPRSVILGATATLSSLLGMLVWALVRPGQRFRLLNQHTPRNSRF